MVQQQIVDYVKAQLKVGVGRDVIKNALIGAGWLALDVEDSMKGLDVAPSVSAGLTPPASSLASLGSASFAGVATKAESVRSGPTKDVAATAGKPVSGVSQTALTSPNILISDLISSPKLETASPVEKAKQKVELPKKAVEVFSKEEKPRSSGKSAVTIVLGILAIAFAAAVAYLYFQNISLQGKNQTYLSQVNEFSAKEASLNTQVADLTKSKDDLSNQLLPLASESKELKAELSLFVVPPGSSSTEPLAVVLGGTLASSSKQYTLTTSNGVRITLVNSKDEKIEAVLKPLVGQVVEISGTHAPGSRDVTITGVNGAAIQK